MITMLSLLNFTAVLFSPAKFLCLACSALVSLKFKCQKITRNQRNIFTFHSSLRGLHTLMQDQMVSIQFWQKKCISLKVVATKRDTSA